MIGRAEGVAVSTEGVKVKAARHRKWYRSLMMALVLSMLSLAAQAEMADLDERTDERLDEAARGGVVSSASRSLVGTKAAVLQGIIYVDAHGLSDPSPGDPNIGDPD